MELLFINNLMSNFNYREVEVPLISKKNTTIKVYSLLVKDELEFISAMTLTSYKREERFLRLLFSKIDFESKNKLWNNDFDTFLKNITDPDINAITMGIIIATHSDSYEYDWVCPHCQTKNKYSINPIQVAQTTYPDSEDLLTSSIRIFEVENENIILKIKASYPNYLRLINLSRYVEEVYSKESPDTRTGLEIYIKDFLSPIEEVKFIENTGREIKTLRTDNYEELETLVVIFNGLTNKVKKEIKKNTTGIIDKEYGTLLKFKTQCTNQNCRRTTEHTITPLQLFLSMTLD